MFTGSAAARAFLAVLAAMVLPQTGWIFAAAPSPATFVDAARAYFAAAVAAAFDAYAVPLQTASAVAVVTWLLPLVWRMLCSLTTKVSRPGSTSAVVEGEFGAAILRQMHEAACQKNDLERFGKLFHAVAHLKQQSAELAAADFDTLKVALSAADAALTHAAVDGRLSYERAMNAACVLHLTNGLFEGFRNRHVFEASIRQHIFQLQLMVDEANASPASEKLSPELLRSAAHLLRYADERQRFAADGESGLVPPPEFPGMKLHSRRQTGQAGAPQAAAVVTANGGGRQRSTRGPAGAGDSKPFDATPTPRQGGSTGGLEGGSPARQL
jgi:hypothetical protein